MVTSYEFYSVHLQILRFENNQLPLSLHYVDVFFQLPFVVIIYSAMKYVCAARIPVLGPLLHFIYAHDYPLQEDVEVVAFYRMTQVSRLKACGRG